MQITTAISPATTTCSPSPGGDHPRHPCGLLEAGADIVTTNTFNANRVSQEDYGLAAAVRALNLASARIAREAADAAASAERPRYVAGVLGPTNKTLSGLAGCERPGQAHDRFSALGAAYREAAEALIAGGVDLILLETIFDSLNAKAALVALEEMFEASGTRLPISSRAPSPTARAACSTARPWRRSG